LPFGDFSTPSGFLRFGGDNPPLFTYRKYSSEPLAPLAFFRVFLSETQRSGLGNRPKG